MKNQYGLAKLACYTNNLSMSVVANLSPLLFLTFKEQYGLSYSLLGLLVLVNYCTQLSVDVLFSMFSHRLDVSRIIRFNPAITLTGFVVYALPPIFFPQAAYAFIMAGTVIFSAAAGLSEVLTSPVIAAMPSENPDREMSKLHSVYAWGVVGVVIISTLFILVFGGENWQYLALMWSVMPILGLIAFANAELPPLNVSRKTAGGGGAAHGRRMLLCVTCIFFGGVTECTMAQWSSGYIEAALGLPKIWGDVLGVAMFALMLAVGRSSYAKWGKSIYPILTLGFGGAFVCYVVSAVSDSSVVGLVACVLTGLCASMLWPGSLIMMEGMIPSAGVTAYALMAAGGDLGAAVGPQLVGVIADGAGKLEPLAALAQRLGITSDQLGMRLGVVVASLFVLSGLILVLLIRCRNHSAKRAK